MILFTSTGMAGNLFKADPIPIIKEPITTFQI